MDETGEYLTQEKHDEIRNELEFLKHTRRKEVAESLEYAKSLGDLSENAEYHEARDVQANTEDRIARLETILKNAKIVQAAPGSVTEVVIGCTVTVQKGEETETKTFTIVGSEEADSSVGKISTKSPIGQALLGKKKKDQVSVKTPAGIVAYRIVSIK